MVFRTMILSTDPLCPLSSRWSLKIQNSILDLTQTSFLPVVSSHFLFHLSRCTLPGLRHCSTHFQVRKIMARTFGAAVIIALEEWRHWLEGAELRFLDWTDHKNLEYLQTAKRLNPRQAPFFHLFGWLNYALSCCPGSKKGKLDALSCQFNLGILHHYQSSLP